jgi:DNA-binding MarR family transcriptional regulator
VANKQLKLKIFLKKGELRREVWDCLDGEKTATDIAKEIKKHRSAVSRVLLDMEKAGFIKCVNPEDKSFRHYVKNIGKF